MALSKVIQVPNIISIVGSTIRVAHPSLDGYTNTRLSAQITAAGTGMTVYDNDGFVDNDWMIVGPISDSKTEPTDVNGAVSRGTSMTVTNYLAFNHSIDAPVTRILERGIKIYGAATDGGAGTLIASIDAITASGRQLADAFMIQWDKAHTEYTLLNTDTAFAYYYTTFTDGTTESASSDYVLASGPTFNALSPLVDRALTYTNTEISARKITYPMLVDWSQDAQEAITQFVYQDPTTGMLMQKDWSFEVTEDTGISTVENENKYALSALSPATKYPNSNKSIISVRIGKHYPLKWINIDDYDEYMRGKARTDVASTISAGDVAITVDDTSDFESAGSLYIGSEVGITYTAKTPTTFTGIPASGTGAITATHAVDAPIWQGIDPGRPRQYTIYEGNIYLDRPVDTNIAGEKLKVRHFKALTRLTDISDTTAVTFTNVFPTYIAAMIERRQGNYEVSQMYMTEFQKQVLNNAKADYIPTLDEYTHHNYVDGTYRRWRDDTTEYPFNFR